MRQWIWPEQQQQQNNFKYIVYAYIMWTNFDVCFDQIVGNWVDLVTVDSINSVSVILLS